MTSLERAKRFLQNKTRALALTAAPLAVLAVAAVPANAGIAQLQFNTASCAVSANGGSPTGSCTDTTLGTMPNGVNGLHLSGDASVVFTAGSGSFSLLMDWGQGTTN